jgi:copper oxidase (laccase) domain-containing protein
VVPPFFLTAPSVHVPHGFFGQSPHQADLFDASLNTNPSGAAANRRIAGHLMGAHTCVFARQMHTNAALCLTQEVFTQPDSFSWLEPPFSQGLARGLGSMPQAQSANLESESKGNEQKGWQDVCIAVTTKACDGLATRIAGVGLGLLTADCGPLLFWDPAGVIGACHAGWRGAVSGVMESTLAAMRDLGAQPERIVAALGPTIWAKDYPVGDDFLDLVARQVNPSMDRDQINGVHLANPAVPTSATTSATTPTCPEVAPHRCPVPISDPQNDLPVKDFLVPFGGKTHFNLPGYIKARLAGQVGTFYDLGQNTFSPDNPRFFSWRRNLCHPSTTTDLPGQAPSGPRPVTKVSNNLSLIVLP